MAPKKKQPERQHISQTPFSALLSQFVGTDDSLTSFADDGISISPALITHMTTPLGDKKKSPKKKGSFDGIDLDHDDRPAIDLESDIESLMPDDDEYDDSFDRLIEDAFHEDEDVTLRNNLVAMGRKWAIKGMDEAAESSEVNRSFIRQEQALQSLAEEMDAGASALDRDIEQMRMSRTKNYKSMADMISARVSLYNAKLSVIKEMNAITKSKYDITMKLKKEAGNEAGDSGMAATQAVQRLLSVGRKNLIPSDDGMREYVPNGDDSPGGANYNDGTPETALHLAEDLPPAETDGDKFIEHEGDGIEYVVDIDRETDRKQIYAINKYGDVVPDYPMPSNQDQLNFQLNEMAGEATDQLQRRYRLRYDGEDVGDHSYSEPID